MLGVVKLLVPVPPVSTVPPVAAAYQSTVTPVGVTALINTVPGPQRDPGVPAVGVLGMVLMVAVIGVLVAEVQEPAI